MQNTAAEPIKSRNHSRRKWKNMLVGYSFILPNFIGFFLLVLLPSAFTIVMSFCKWTGAGFQEFVGLKNYIKMFHTSNFQIALKNTAFYALGTIPLTLIGALFIASLLNRKIHGRGMFRSICFWPYVTPVVALAAVWNMLFNPNMGPINSMLSAIGIPASMIPRWTASTTWSLPTVMLAQIWRGIGYYMVIFLAGLQSIPGEYYEAAQMDGANKRNCFLKITLPLLSPTVFYVLIMLSIDAFQVYDIVSVMTDGGPGRSSTVLAMHIYDSAFVQNKYGYASAVSMVLFVIVAGITLIQFRCEKKWVDY